MRLFVGQPYCEHAAVLAHWAQAHGAVVLQPPTAGQILAGDRRWLDEFTPGAGQPWVLPALERCFLRHASGLDLVRGFLARALSVDVARARAQGIDAVGPESPDSLFARARRGEFDWVLALYHDQGLIPVKLLDAVGKGRRDEGRC